MKTLLLFLIVLFAFSCTENNISTSTTQHTTFTETDNSGNIIHSAADWLSISDTIENFNFTIFAAYPNPCITETTLHFITNKTIDLNITILDHYNTSCYNKLIDSGNYSITLNTKNLENKIYSIYYTIRLMKYDSVSSTYRIKTYQSFGNLKKI